MTYTPQQTEPLALRLCRDLPGLHIELARCWITAESGVNNNPLGVTIIVNDVRVLAKYPTAFSGIDAAAERVKTQSNYAGIIASLGGTLRQQALAVIHSPWNVPNSPYYTREFTACGLLFGVTRAEALAALEATFTTLHQLHVWNQGTEAQRAALIKSFTPHQTHLLHVYNITP